MISKACGKLESIAVDKNLLGSQNGFQNWKRMSKNQCFIPELIFGEGMFGNPRMGDEGLLHFIQAMTFNIQGDEEEQKRQKDANKPHVDEFEDKETKK